MQEEIHRIVVGIPLSRVEGPRPGCEQKRTATAGAVAAIT